MERDNINPEYYKGKVEVIDAIETWGLNFHRGNAIKYIARAGKKNKEAEIEDLEKAAWYINREIQRLEKLKKNKDRKQVDYERQNYYIVVYVFNSRSDIHFRIVTAVKPDKLGLDMGNLPRMDSCGNTTISNANTNNNRNIYGF